MSIWYRVGTVTVTNGDATVTGVDTTFNTSVYPGDLFTIDENIVYEIASVTDNLNFELQKVYAGTTASGASYAVVPLSPKRQLTSDLASRVNTLIEQYREALDGWVAGGWGVDTNGDYKVSGVVERSLVPINDGGGGLGTATKAWGSVYTEDLNISGTITAPTQAPGDNSTKLATTAYADAKVSNTLTNGVTGIAPSQDVVFDALALKSTIASPTFTGTPKSTTAVAGTNTTQIATTAYTMALVASLKATNATFVMIANQTDIDVASIWVKETSNITVYLNGLHLIESVDYSQSFVTKKIILSKASTANETVHIVITPYILI